MNKSVGVAIIARDAEATLEVTLKSIQDCFDQQVLVDTGSTDRTIEIAKAYGFDTYHFEWIQDFAAARNYSFDQLKTDWAFWIDTDDILIGRGYLDELVLKAEEMQLEGVALEYFYSFDDAGQALLAQMEPEILRNPGMIHGLYDQLRAHCNTTQYRERLISLKDRSWKWLYPVHEALPAWGRRMGKYEQMKLAHRRHLKKDGIVPDRNLKILEAWPESKRDDRILFYLGLEYAHRQKWAEARRFFTEYLPLSTVDDEKYLAYCFLSDIHRFAGEPNEAVQRALMAVEMRPTWRTAYICLLETYVGQKNWIKAVYYGAKIAQAETPDTPFAYNPIHHEMSWINQYVLALFESGQYDEALKVTQYGLSKTPNDSMLQHNEAEISCLLNQLAGIKSVAETVEFFARTDNCDIAAMLLSRLGPEFKTNPQIKRWIARIGEACGRASLGYLPTGVVKQTVTTDLGPWDDARARKLWDSLVTRPGTSSILCLGTPSTLSQDLVRIASHKVVQLESLQQLDEASKHGPYDVAVLWSCLEQVPDPIGLTERVRSMVKPGGFLMASIPNGPSTRGLGLPDHLRLRVISSDFFRQIMGTVQIPESLPGGITDGGDLWLSVPLPSLPGTPKRIGVVCPPAPEPWGPESLGRGIGGSEEAVIRLSRAFSRRGHIVTVYGAGSVGADVGLYGEISYKPLSEYAPPQILIGWRYPEIFASLRPYEAEWKALWMHDSIQKERVAACASAIDAIWTISKYHAGLYAGVPKIYEGRNGIDPFEIQEEEDAVKEKNIHKCVFVSTPFRGLDVLLSLWPAIKAEVPTAELHAYYGWEAADRMGVTATEQGKTFKQQVMAEVERQEVIWHGRIGQRELYRELLSAGAWTYPSTWNEENCISAYLAQACGTWPVVTPVGALPQSVVYGWKVDRDHFVEATVEALRTNDPGRRQQMATWARRYLTWDQVASQWEDLWMGRIRCA